MKEAGKNRDKQSCRVNSAVWRKFLEHSWVSRSSPRAYLAGRIAGGDDLDIWKATLSAPIMKQFYEGSNRKKAIFSDIRFGDCLPFRSISRCLRTLKDTKHLVVVVMKQKVMFCRKKRRSTQDYRNIILAVGNGRKTRPSNHVTLQYLPRADHIPPYFQQHSHMTRDDQEHYGFRGM